MDDHEETSAPPRGVSKIKMNYYAPVEDAGRIRAAFFAGRDEAGWRSLTDFQVDAMMQLVERLEARHNRGLPFEGLGPGSIPAGRPLE